MTDRSALERHPFGLPRGDRELTAGERAWVVVQAAAVPNVRFYDGALRAEARFLADCLDREEGLARLRAAEYIW